MRCPWCDFDGAVRALHAHLAEQHQDKVALERRKLAAYYVVACPVCGQTYEHAIKPRLDDPSFVEEFRYEISLVGFDMLINHLLAEHEAQEA